jgi:hypothetical protein
MAENPQVGVDRVFVQGSIIFRHLVKLKAARYDAIATAKSLI